MKTINELKDGKCVVIAEKNGVVKKFAGHFVSKYPAVFFTIPADYKILGYEQ
jgi:hypothetical protein